MTKIDTIPGLKEILDKTQEDIQRIIGTPVTVHYRINKHKVSMDRLINAVCIAGEVTLMELQKDNRAHKFAMPRQIFCWFAYRWCNMTLMAISEFINRDHSSVLVARDKVDDMIDIKDHDYMSLMEVIKSKLIAE